MGLVLVCDVGEGDWCEGEMWACWAGGGWAGRCDWGWGTDWEDIVAGDAWGMKEEE